MGDYDDIINMPHYEPKHHPRMSMENRAAQFAPFAALAGYDDAIREEGRITDDWLDPGDSGSDELNRRMARLITMLPERPVVTIDYFLPDSHKTGGAYRSASGVVRRVDEYERVIEMADGRKIMIDLVKDISIEG